MARGTRVWGWHVITQSNVGEMVRAENAALSKPQAVWPKPEHDVHLVTEAGLRLRARTSAGNPSLAFSPNAHRQLRPRCQVRLATRGDEIAAVGLPRVEHHPADDAILEAHGIDTGASHAWAREIDWWNADEPNPLATVDTLAYVLADGRHTAGLRIRGDLVTKMGGGDPLGPDDDYSYENGELHVRGIPATIATTLRGRRLSSVVSVSRLDRLPLRIHAVRFEGERTSLRIVPTTGWTSLIG